LPDFGRRGDRAPSVEGGHRRATLFWGTVFAESLR
jgi:hypothetical protein